MAAQTSVFTWGFGKYGQLGNGDSRNCELPQTARLPFNPSAVSCGGHFTAVIAAEKLGKSTSDKELLAAKRSSPPTGRVFTCGWGKYGRLGSGKEEDRLALLEISSSLDAIALSAGHWHACCVSHEGVLYSWGYNKHHGVLGRDGHASDPIPKPIAIPGVCFSQVACGYNYTIAVSDGSVVFSWGCGKYGTLGHGDTQDKVTPTVVKGLSEQQIITASAGYSHSAVVSSDGRMYVWGRGEGGALGQGKDHSDKLQPVEVETLVQKGVRMVQCSCSQGEHHAHTLACTSEGEAWSWGDGYKGKLGLGNQESKDIPTKIDSAHFDSPVVQVACGGIHSAAVTEGGGVYTWGCGSDGRLGHPDAKGHRYLFRSDVPRKVEYFTSDWSAVQVSCSYYHTAALCKKRL